MQREACDRREAKMMSRRTMMKAMGAAAGAAVVVPGVALAQGTPAEPPSTVTTPPRDFGPNAPPNVYFTDPDVITIDPMFNGLRQPNAPIQRLWTGAPWSEGPAWSSQGGSLVWSDTPNNAELPGVGDDARVAALRVPSSSRHGKTFALQAR